MSTKTKRSGRTKGSNTTARTTGKRSIGKTVTSERFVLKNRENYNQRDWVVFSSNNGNPRLFASRLTRDNVRTAYSSEFGVRIQTTRSRRVKNY